jgi:UDP-N-acetylglucosamine--N-acetylmuramyl-(pentapeptide) pyrophosphoryl-undecaprenol N-acetylglucosamine transferase
MFPGIAVARAMQQRGCEVSLLISEKRVDLQGAGTVPDLRTVTLPAIGLVSGRRLAFVRGFTGSYCKCLRLFKQRRADIVLAMGGFTSAPPLLAARAFGAAAFLHESNSIPGRANRWLSRFVRESFIGFPSAAKRLRSRKVTVTGTPVRPEFWKIKTAYCLSALKLDRLRPVVLVMGGSQGAEAINRLVLDSLPLFSGELRNCQWLHIAGPAMAGTLREAYSAARVDGLVYEFMPRMDLALGAATVAISRSGASSLAELAAAELPAVLIPFPTATDNHQYYNAKALADSGAALMLEQGVPARDMLAGLEHLLFDPARRATIQEGLQKWQSRSAADQIAEAMLRAAGFAISRKVPTAASLAVPEAEPAENLSGFVVRQKARFERGRAGA